jgi:glucose-1-phosphate adenylyltransferase
MISQQKTFVYRFDSYWQDIGTLDAYYEANLDLVNERPQLDLFERDWKIHTPSAERPPVKFGPGGNAVRSLIANGCIVLGRVERSVLFPGVFVGPEAQVTGAIIMNDTRVESGCQIDRAILDKSIRVGEGAVIGWGDSAPPNREIPALLYSGLTVVGKGAYVPPGTRVGRNCCLAADVGEKDFPETEVPAGSMVGRAEG